MSQRCENCIPRACLQLVLAQTAIAVDVSISRLHLIPVMLCDTTANLSNTCIFCDPSLQCQENKRSGLSVKVYLYQINMQIWGINVSNINSQEDICLINGLNLEMLHQYRKENSVLMYSYIYCKYAAYFIVCCIYTCTVKYGKFCCVL